MAESSDNQRHVTVALKTVYCHNAQGVMDVDLFYVAGGAATGPLSGSKSMTVLTGLVEINSRQAKLLAGDDCVIFDGNVHVDDFVEFGLQFRSSNADVDEGDFDDKYPASVSALTADVGAGAGSANASVKGAVAGAILAATPLALARVQARASIYEDDVLGTVQKRVNVVDYPDGRSGPFKWKFADKYPITLADTGELGWSEWDYEIEYTIDVGPAR
ncbi:hypothetical protein [Nonomuraea rhodomycinica]|uniref:Uncharacterized protein n=1 Tax=Nonomuraea rhodomycinica TaxID=1712872 RepID=A0A7Y6ITP3_9ACTN|nr:hypothetical protein [Nonomuraea rhodomycinica]NUW43918.1 hypothetical protein [Nonomuraea rhodomycinica]